VEAAQAVNLPVMLSFAQVNAQGMNMNGQDVFAFIDDICRKYDIFSVGLNCSSGAAQMAPIIQELATRVKCRVSAYPNAGIPNAKGKYEQTGEEFARQCWPMIDSHSVNIIGGCCGTTDRHIAALQPLIEPATRCFVSPKGNDVVRPRYKQLYSRVVARGDRNGRSDLSTLNDRNDRNTRSTLTTPSTQKAPTTQKAPADPKERLLQAIVNGHQEEALEATKAALEAGADATSLINNQMICAMGLVGKNFEEGKAFVPQLLMAGRAMKAALGYIKQHEAAAGKTAGIQAIGKVVIGTVKGDLHDIGKNLVASMLEGSGFEVVNIGIDIDADTFVKAVVDNHADILCLSALLTTTMTYMKDVLDALQAAGIRDKVKVMVGGAPVSQAFADEIGADGYSANANEAVAVAKRLLAL
jgi:corrinoid protein of di/trimethylamine methyltransferase